MPKEEIEDLLENNVWLPRKAETERKLFKRWRNEKIRKSVEKEFVGYMKNDDLVKKVQKDFEGDERMSVLAQMFVMEKEFQKRWDFENEEWFEIKQS